MVTKRLSKIVRLILSAGAALLLMGLLLPLPVAASPGATVSVDVDNPTPIYGEEIVAHLDITAVTNLNAASYKVMFDSSVIELTDITDGLIGGSSFPVSLYQEITGGVSIVQDVPGLGGLTGAGYLCQLHFTAVGDPADSTPVNVENLSLSDNEAHPIPVDSVVGATVEIIAAADTTPPTDVTDLAVSNPTLNSLTLTWTAPGDDGSIGTASEYDIRYANAAINTEAKWTAATPVSGEPSPNVAGSHESFVATGLTPDTTYYFALKTADEVPNSSGLSNSPHGATSSAPVAPTVAFSAATYSVGEGDDSATITVSLSAASDETVTVDYATSDGTATAPDDYTAASGTLTFAAGDTEESFPVTIIDDASVESDETVDLDLSSPSNAILGTPHAAVLTIVDNDVAPGALVADADGPYSGTAGKSLSLSGSATGGTSPYTYVWDLDNDGTYESPGKDVNHTWAAAGDYTVGLKVTDSASPADTDTDTASMHITTVPPPSVGGTAYPANKLLVLAPWIALGLAIIAGTALFVRRRRAQT